MGVITGVGKGEGVEVGGNQAKVTVGIALGGTVVLVFVGGTGGGVLWQPLKQRLNSPNIIKRRLVNVSFGR